MSKPARVPSMGEVVTTGVTLCLIIMILEPMETLFDRVFFCSGMILGTIVIGYILRKVAMWQITRDRQPEESEAC